MADITLERLNQIPLMGKLTEQEVQALLPRAEERSLSAAETLFSEGDPVEFLYFIERGRVTEQRVDPGVRQVLPRHAGQGDYLGRYALMTGRPYEVMATADEETTLLAIPLRHLQPILFSYPDWRNWFFEIDIAARLRAVPLFMALDDWDLYRLADQVKVEDYGSEAVIFDAGDPADSFYIIDRGQVIETASSPATPGDWPQYLAAGNYFGRRSLAAGQRYGTRAAARLPTHLFCIPGRIVGELLAIRATGLTPGLPRVDVMGRLKGVSLFRDLKVEHLRLLAGYASLEYRRPGDIVARQGDPATGLMILEEGEAIVRRQIGQVRPRPVGYLKAYPSAGGRSGSATQADSESVYFGDHALLADEMRGATIEVTEPSTWIVLDRKDFQSFLKDAGLRSEDLAHTPQLDAQSGVPTSPQDEHLRLPFVTRRHWIIPVARILPLLLVMIVVLVLVAADVISNLSGGLQAFLMWGGLAVAVLLVFWTVWRYLDWRNDTYQVTNEAVIHIEKVIFFSEERYEAPLRQIQNVNIMIGLLGRLLGYGDLGIDTAAAKGQVRFTTIPDPAFVQRLIQQASAEARSGHPIQERESIRQQLEDQFYPDRLKATMPGSVSSPPGATPSEPSPPPRPSRFRTLGGWFPRFEIVEPDRVIWRKHWFNLLQRTGLATLAFLFSSYLLLAHVLAYVTYVSNLELIALPPLGLFGFQGWLFFLTGVLWILAVLWLLYQYVDWRNDIYVLTENEVIDVERQLAVFPFFFLSTESRKQASLANVQFVDLQIPNLLAMIFNYGDVIVQTAGAEGRLDFLFVSNPRHVQAEVLRYLTAYQDRQREREFKERWGGLAEWFETYKNLVDQNKPGRDSVAAR